MSRKIKISRVRCVRVSVVCRQICSRWQLTNGIGFCSGKKLYHDQANVIERRRVFCDIPFWEQVSLKAILRTSQYTVRQRIIVAFLMKNGPERVVEDVGVQFSLLHLDVGSRKER